MPHQDVRSLVLSVNDEKMTEQLLEQLLKYLPNREEMQQLIPYKSKINDLSEAEQFGVVVRKRESGLVQWIDAHI